jgi:hypothetical protein
VPREQLPQHRTRAVLVPPDRCEGSSASAMALRLASSASGVKGISTELSQYRMGNTQHLSCPRPKRYFDHVTLLRCTVLCKLHLEDRYVIYTIHTGPMEGNESIGGRSQLTTLCR